MSCGQLARRCLVDSDETLTTRRDGSFPRTSAAPPLQTGRAAAPRLQRLLECWRQRCERERDTRSHRRPATSHGDEPLCSRWCTTTALRARTCFVDSYCVGCVCQQTSSDRLNCVGKQRHFSYLCRPPHRQSGQGIKCGPDLSELTRKYFCSIAHWPAMFTLQKKSMLSVIILILPFSERKTETNADSLRYDAVRYSGFTCAQKLKRWPA